MVLGYPITLSFVVLVASVTYAAASFAQTPAVSSTARTSPTAPARSAFEGYSAYSDEPVSNWQAANDNVARIGGWREYARQAQSDQPAPPSVAQQDAKPALKAAP